MNRHNHGRILIAFLALTVLLSGLVSVNAQAGITYYVALNGNNANSGTEAQPFLTLAKGVSVLKPGDTLLVRAGMYREELWDTIPSGTSWDKAVTLRAYPGEQVIIQPNTGADRVITITGNRQYIIIDGFILDGTNVKAETVKIAGDMVKASPTYIRIINNEVRNAGAMTSSNGQYKAFGSGILTTGRANYVEYINNVIHNNGVTDFDHGIYHTSSYGLIEGNIIYGNMGSGIKIGGGQNAVDNIIRNNVIYDNNAAQGEDGRKKQGRGIGVYDGSGTLIYNNVIWGGHMIGIDVTYDGDNAKVFNNTVISTTGYGITVGIGADTSPTAHNAVVKNNIVYQQSTLPAILNSRGINVLFENNLTFGLNPIITAKSQVASSTVFQDNLENVDPGFVDIGAKNFALRSDSRAIDKGVSIGEVSFDFADVTRPQGIAYDIGAYEFVGQVIPAGETPIPLPATPLPPVPTPVAYTHPTVYLSVVNTPAQVGETVNVAVNVVNGANLFGIEARCITNPAVLVGVDSTDGAIFSNSNSIFMSQPYNPADGKWSVAASRTRPEVPFSGDGLAFTLNYRLEGAGNSPVNCTIIAVDQNGHVVPFDVVNTSFDFQSPTVDPQEQPTIEAEIPDPPGLEEQPLPTDVPPPTATAIPPTSIPVVPTETLAANVGSITGAVSYQSLSSNLGIAVQLLADDVIVKETLTDVSGGYNFNNLAPGTYTVKALALQYLPAAQVVSIGDGEIIALDRITLLAGDVDNNQTIDLADASMIGANFGVQGSLVPQADLNQDDLINISDLAIIGGNFGLSGVITVQ